MSTGDQGECQLYTKVSYNKRALWSSVYNNRIYKENGQVKGLDSLEICLDKLLAIQSLKSLAKDFPSHFNDLDSFRQLNHTKKRAAIFHYLVLLLLPYNEEVVTLPLASGNTLDTTNQERTKVQSFHVIRSEQVDVP